MELLVDIILILVAAKLGGYLFKKLKQSAVLGEIIAGIIIGPAVLGIFQPTEITRFLADIGIMMLMFLVGLELNLKTFEKFLKSGSITAIFGAFIPFFAGIFISSNFFGWSVLPSFFFGVALMATSVSITAATLKELKKLKTPVGSTLLDAAVIDDIIAVAMLAFLLGIVGGGVVSFETITLLGLKIVLFFGAVLFIGPYLGRYLIKIGKGLNLRVEEGLLSIIIVLLFGLAFLGKGVGLSTIIGAFLAGVILDKRKLVHVEHEIYGMTYGLFIPFFFVFIGTYINLGILYEHFILILLIFSIAFLTKFFGALLGAKISGMKLKDSLTVGIGMVPRSEVALIIVSLGLTSGVLSDTLYSVIVSALILTILVTPPLLKWVER